MKNLFYSLLFLYLITSCNSYYRSSNNHVEVSSILIKLYMDSCVDVSNKNLTTLRLVVNNKGNKAFEFKLINLNFGKITDSTGNELDRFKLSDPVIRSQKLTYIINSDEEKEIEIGINNLHQFLFPKRGTYFLINSYYKVRSSSNSSKNGDKIYTNDVKFFICKNN